MNIKTGDIQQRALGLARLVRACAPRGADGKGALHRVCSSHRSRWRCDPTGWLGGGQLSQKPSVLVGSQMHDHPAIGKATSVGVVNGELEIEIEWAPTAFAQDIKALYDGKFMRAVSVGFRVLDWTYS